MRQQSPPEKRWYVSWEDILREILEHCPEHLQCARTWACPEQDLRTGQGPDCIHYIVEVGPHPGLGNWKETFKLRLFPDRVELEAPDHGIVEFRLKENPKPSSPWDPTTNYEILRKTIGATEIRRRHGEKT